MDDLADPDTPTRQSSKLSLGSSPSSVLSADEQLDDADGPLTPTERIIDEDDLFGSAIHADSPEPPLSNSLSADEANYDDLQTEQYSASSLSLSDVPDDFTLSRSLSPTGIEQSPPPPQLPKKRTKKRRRKRRGEDDGEEDEEDEETDSQRQNGHNPDTSEAKQGRHGRQEGFKAQEKDTSDDMPEKEAKGRKRRTARTITSSDSRTRRRLSRQDITQSTEKSTDQSGNEDREHSSDRLTRKNDIKPSKAKGDIRNDAGESDNKGEEDEEQEQESKATSSGPESITNQTKPTTAAAEATSETVLGPETDASMTLMSNTEGTSLINTTLLNNADIEDWDQKRHKEALNALTHIEVEFARLRDKMYREKMAELNEEAILIAKGEHPELKALMAEIEEKKARRIQSAEAWRKHQHANYRQQFEGFEYQANVHFLSKKNELRRNILATVNRKRWTMESERSKLNEPSSSERLLADGQTMMRRKRAQKEESAELQDIKEAIGFPIAPTASGLSSRDINEDLATLRQKVANQ